MSLDQKEKRLSSDVFHFIYRIFLCRERSVCLLRIFLGDKKIGLDGLAAAAFNFFLATEPNPDFAKVFEKLRKF